MFWCLRLWPRGWGSVEIMWGGTEQEREGSGPKYQRKEAGGMLLESWREREEYVRFEMAGVTILSSRSFHSAHHSLLRFSAGQMDSCKFFHLPPILREPLAMLNTKPQMDQFTHILK